MESSDGKETIVRIPVIVEPIEVQITLGTVPVEIHHVAVAVDLGEGAMCNKPSIFTPRVIVK
jgi:hypothetical protein